MAESESKANTTLSRIVKGMEDGQCACLPDMLRMIHKLSEKVQDMAIQELANLIKNDTVVLEKVVSAANTIGYNPSGVEISSVGEAIQVIGFDRVRSLSMSLILLENANTWQFSDERRQATLTSLTSGIFAEQVAAEGSEVNPELAFLCGALRGFGRIVLATYMLDEFKEAEKLGGELTTDRAYREIFGLTPIELGHHLMEASHMSPTLLKTLKDYHPEKHRKSLLSPEDKLLAVADFSYQVAQVAINEAVSEEEFKKCTHRLKDRYKHVAEQIFPALDTVLKKTNDQLKALIRSSGPAAFPVKAVRCLQFRVEHADPPPPEPKKGPKHATESPGEGTPQDLDLWKAGIERMRAFAQEGQELQGKVINDILETVRKGLACDECWAFLQLPGKPGYSFEQGLGAHSIILQGRTRVLPGERSIFGLCLSRRESIFINDARDPKIRAHLPDWYRNNVMLNSFVLLCLQNRERVVGLIFAGWRSAGEVEIKPEHSRLIHQLLSIATTMR